MFELKKSFYDHKAACFRSVTIARVSGWDEGDKILSKKRLLGHFYLAPIAKKG